MRPPERSPMPDLDRILREANELLAGHGLPPCTRLEPVDDPDTANANVVGYAEGRRYVIKISLRHPDTLERQLRVANAIADETGLPIPRHLCYAEGADRLPLLVTEWMPGDQLRTALRSAPRAAVEELANNWGSCVARTHRAGIDLTEYDVQTADEYHAGFGRWLIRTSRLRQAMLGDRVEWTDEEVSAVGVYLAEREEPFSEPGALGVVKADQDVRDALALLEPRPHVSAMLDWERVNHGDTLWEVANVFVRFRVLGLGGLWPWFREGYEREARAPLAVGPHLECYVMVRALIASTAPALALSEDARGQSDAIVRECLDARGLSI